MSTFRVDNIQSSNTSPSVFKNVNGTEIGTLCRSWISHNGTASTVKGSLNISSVTKPATGAYVLNFSIAFSDANYSLLGTNDFAASFVICTDSGVAVPTSSSCRINSRSSAASLTDTAYMYVSVFR